MYGLDFYFAMMLGLQLIHSFEELSNKFHKRFPFLKMTFRFFLMFEIVFFLFWLAVLLFPNFPSRDTLQLFFIYLMLINGIWHIIWAGMEKKYVPGLVSAPLFVIGFIYFIISKL